MALFEINQETCNQDGLCAAVCPVAVIDFSKGEFPKPSEMAADICIRCGHCVAVCPTASLSHTDMPVDECVPVQNELQLSIEQCQQFLRNRRSIRAYKDKSVPKDELTRLIEIARYAPTGHNTQAVEWMVFSDKTVLHNFGSLIADWMRFMIDNMPEIAEMLHMDRAIARWESGKDPYLRSAPTLIMTHAHKDHRMAPTACTIALTYLELAATSMGLGTCWAGFFNTAATLFPPMIEALPLPPDHVCLGAMMVGYPKFKYQRLPLRKPPKITWYSG